MDTPAQRPIDPPNRPAGDAAEWLRIGGVALAVRDLDRVAAFYRDVIGLEVIAHDGDAIHLGAGGSVFLDLLHRPGALPHDPATAGLFHTAFLLPSRAELGRWLAHYRALGGQLDGGADHLVSEAAYLRDPEGNGIELYWDRARTEWSWTHGRVEMATLMLDPNAFLREHHHDQGNHAGAAARPAAVGHVHLSVGDVATARAFYVDRLGFETTAEFGSSALFVSAGGYHHHMAMNTWKSAGAGRRRLALGLGLVRIHLPSADDLGSLGERLRHFGVAGDDDGRVLRVDDPWANRIEVTAGLS